MNVVIGWVDSYNRVYPSTTFNNDRRKALVERIRKRSYNFTHFDHSYLQYGAPYYDDGKFCVLTKAQWDDVMREAYKVEIRFFFKKKVEGTSLAVQWLRLPLPMQ